MSHEKDFQGRNGTHNFPPFDPPWWMRNPHFQTIFATKKPRRFRFGWETWQPLEISIGSDGSILAEVSWQPGPLSASPALVLFHGMEGSARSHYLIGMGRKAYARGFHVVRVNTRNCGSTEHMTSTLYCAGLSQDVGAVVQCLQHKHGISSIFAAGVSLGANLLLKFLGEKGARGDEYIRAAAAVSAPIDLAAGARKIGDSGNGFYQRYFVARLIKHLRRKAMLFPGIADVARVERIRTIYEFDDVVTAPHFGYGNAENYYRLASSGPLLREVRVPTLIVQAMDDPLIPFEPFLIPGIETNPALHLLATRRGGHAGFITATRAKPEDYDCYWAESRVVDFLADCADL